MPMLVIDLEATCSEDGSIAGTEMEIIEVGAVWAQDDGSVLETFHSYVRPTINPTLTAFCTGLTGVTQDLVDRAQPWPMVAPQLLEFSARHDGPRWGSWGNFDRKQIEHESSLAGLPCPLSRLTHVNLKAAFAKQRRIKQVGMATALKICQISLTGEHHRALDDATNIARLLPFVITPL